MSNPMGNIFHSPEMFRVFAQAARHHPKQWAAVDRNGKIAALLIPVEVSVMPRPLHYLTTRAVAYGSVLCQPGEEGRQALALLLEVYRRNLGHDILFTELRHLTDHVSLQTVLANAGFRHEDHLNYIIDLTQPEDTLWRQISSSGRYHIRTAEKRGVAVEDASDVSQVTEAYGLLEKVYSRVQVPLPDISLFQAAFKELSPSSLLKLFVARLGDQPIGAVFNFYYKDRGIGWYAGADREFSKYSATELLVWHSIRWAKRAGMMVFDFGGAGKPGEAYGPRDYKAKFGGELVNYGRDLCIHAPRLLRVSEFGYRIVRQFL